MKNYEKYQIFIIFIEILNIFACDYCRTTEVCKLFNESAEIFKSLACKYDSLEILSSKTISSTEEALLDFMQFSSHFIEQLKVTNLSSLIYFRVKETKRA